MRGRARRVEVGLRARERELERPPLRVRVAFGAGQLAAERFDAFLLRLLELDVLALKTARHATANSRLQYSTRMLSAHELVTRWPALDVAAKRGRLNRSLELTAGPLDRALREASDAAARAANGLWTRDPSAWSADAAVQKAIGDRLGWMTSPALMADSIDRLRTFADAVRRDGFTDVVLLGMGGSSLAPEVLRAVIGVAPGWPRFHMLDSTDPAAVRADGRHRAEDIAVPAREQIGQRRSSRTRSPRISGRRSSSPACRAGALTSSRSPIPGPPSRSARARKGSATCSSTPPTSAAAIRRCRSSAWSPPR